HRLDELAELLAEDGEALLVPPAREELARLGLAALGPPGPEGVDRRLGDGAALGALSALLREETHGAPTYRPGLRGDTGRSALPAREPLEHRVVLLELEVPLALDLAVPTPRRALVLARPGDRHEHREREHRDLPDAPGHRAPALLVLDRRGPPLAAEQPEPVGHEQQLARGERDPEEGVRGHGREEQQEALRVPDALRP